MKTPTTRVKRWVVHLGAKAARLRRSADRGYDPYDAWDRGDARRLETIARNLKHGKLARARVLVRASTISVEDMLPAALVDWAWGDRVPPTCPHPGSSAKRKAAWAAWVDARQIELSYSMQKGARK